MKANGISVVRTDVGDKHVVEEMRRGGFCLGGEQSGHIIHLEHSTTGDGCVAALNVLSVMQRENKRLSELKSIMQEMPQVLINTRVSVRRDLNQIPGYNELVKKLDARLGGEGRLYVRFSGTEPVVRVLVEGPDKKMIAKMAEDIAVFLKSELS
jgi:phosphoglucosamine mutase